MGESTVVLTNNEFSRIETELGNQITIEINDGCWLNALIGQLDYSDCNYVVN